MQRDTSTTRDFQTMVICNRMMAKSRRTARSVYAGFTMVELIATCALMGVLMTITIPTLVVIQHEKRTTEQRQFALQHVTNLLEHPVTRRWSELAPGDLNLPDPDADLLAILPGVERTLTVSQTDEDFMTRQVTASIRWRNQSGEMLPPIRVSTWVFSSHEETP